MCYYPFGMYITTTGVEIKIKKNLFRVKNIILTGVHRIRFKDKKKSEILFAYLNIIGIGFSFIDSFKYLRINYRITRNFHAIRNFRKATHYGK